MGNIYTKLDNKNTAMEKYKKNIMFFDPDLNTIQHYVEVLEERGFMVRGYQNKEKGLLQIKNFPKKFDVIFTEIILGGTDLSDLNEKKKNSFDDASVLCEELKSFNFKGKIMILTSRDNTLFFKNIKTQKFNKVLSKATTSPDDLLKVIEETLVF